MGSREDQETQLVRELGDRLGYGRVMQLCEQIWDAKIPGGAHSVGPCVALLVPCPHQGADNAVECDWCCGAGRVTERVRQAQEEVKS